MCIYICVCMCVTLGIFLNEIPSALFMYILIEFPALLHTGKQTTRVLGIVHEQDSRKFRSPRNAREIVI